MILWDWQNNSKIAHFPYYIKGEPFPPLDYEFPIILYLLSKGWSPNGNEFVHPASQIVDRQLLTQDTPQELFLMNLKGEVERLTFISELYATVRITDLEWSPDGRYIAFLYQVDQENIYKLGIYDRESQLVNDYCIENKNLSEVVWSPDNKQLIFQSEKQEYPYSETLLIDLEKEIKISLPNFYNQFIILNWVEDFR